MLFLGGLVKLHRHIQIVLHSSMSIILSIQGIRRGAQIWKIAYIILECSLMMVLISPLELYPKSGGDLICNSCKIPRFQKMQKIVTEVVT